MRRSAVAVILAMFAITGCSGRSGSVLPATTGSGTQNHAQATVKFTMHWPSKKARRPSYVSPSTQSVVISINASSNPPGPTTFANVSSATGNPPTSTISISAPVGADNFTIALYDQPQVAGEATVAGNLLGQTTLSQTIQPGTLNTLKATVDGVVSIVAVNALANQPTVEPLNFSGFGIVGPTPVVFSLTAEDADGNVIVAPGAVPTVSLTSNSSGLTVTPVANTSNEFTVQAVSATSPSSLPSLYASAVDGAGDTANTVVNINPLSAVYTGYASGGFALYDGSGNMLTLPSGAFAGVKDAVAVAYDYDDNRVFVADSTLNELLAFDAVGNAVSGFTAPSVAGINGVAYDPHNKTVYVTGTAGVSAYTVTGAAAASGAAALSNAVGVAFAATDGSNNPLNELAVGVGGTTPAVDVFSESGSKVSTFSVSGAPTGIAYAPYYPGIYDQIYVVRSGNIDGFSTTGSMQGTFADSNGPYGIAFDPNRGEPYVTEQTTNAIVPYTSMLWGGPDTSATTIQTPASASFTKPAGIAIAY